jgi:hypothetical protein
MSQPLQNASANSSSLPQRLVEVVVLLKENTNATTKENTHQPLLEFLPQSFADQGVLKNLHLFCFPGSGGNIESVSESHGAEGWLYHNFVLTVQNGARLYCHCLRYAFSSLPI